MRKKQTPLASSAEEAIKDIRREARRVWTAEEKLRIEVQGLRREDSISKLCRREKRRLKVLRLVEGVFGGWQAQARWRYARLAFSD